MRDRSKTETARERQKERHIETDRDKQRWRNKGREVDSAQCTEKQRDSRTLIRRQLVRHAKIHYKGKCFWFTEAPSAYAVIIIKQHLLHTIFFKNT